MHKKYFFILGILTFFLAHSGLAATCNVTASGDTTGAKDVTNIKACVSKLGGSGGNVVLGSGTFYLNSPIDLKSNITLYGAGSSSTTVKWVKSVSSVSYMFGYSGSSLSNVTIKSLKLNGQNYWVMGVYIDGTSSSRASKITVRDAIINNCGEYGIHMKQTDGVFVRDVSLDGNGNYSGDSGRSEKNHNIYFRDVTNGFIEYVISTGAAANGINISNSTDVLVSGTDTDDNGQHGIRIEAGTRNRILSCESSGNGENGLEVHPEGSTGNTTICIQNTESTSNDNYGLYFTYTSNYELTDNTISGNTAGDTEMVAISESSTSGVCSKIPTDPSSTWPFTR